MLSHKSEYVIKMLGNHLILDLTGCDRSLLERVDKIIPILNKVCKKAKLNAVHKYFHQFKPTGVTGVIVLKESHINIHTWPEYSKAAIDIFSCNPDKKKVDIAYKLLIEEFKPRKVKKKLLVRR